MTPESAAALVILVLTYVGVAAGRIPGLRLDRAGIAFLGGAAMIATHVKRHRRSASFIRRHSAIEPQPRRAANRSHSAMLAPSIDR
jgi:hypothetical protein